jgi:GT2 family glycosyltransferase
MLMRKKVGEQIKYFDPFGGVSGWREESDFQLQALEKGFKLIFCPHVTGFHHARASASFGANRLRGDLNYLQHIFRHNRLFLDRHRSFLLKNFPSSLILKSPGLTSIFYVIIKAVWLIRVEVLRLYLSRKNQSFEWK